MYNDTHIGAVGNHIAVVGASFTRPANTTAYTVGNAIANSTTAASVVPMTFAGASRDGDISGSVRRARIKVTDTAWLNQTVRLHLYKTKPTSAAGDGAAWSTSESAYLGALDVTFDKQFTDPYVKGIGVPNTGSEINFVPDAGTTQIYGLLQTESAVTPASASVWTVELEIMQN